MKDNILIIGAGPAGLAAAIELARHKKKFLIIEKQDQVGGLAKTYTFNDNGLIFKTDNGPHRFYSKNQYLYEFIGDLIKEQWIEVKRQTRQFIDGKFYDYPVNPAQALVNIGFRKAVKMLFDYLIAKVRFNLFKQKINNFEDYITANFGKSLGSFNMINYTEKIWGVPASSIHIDWAKQRIRGLSVGFLAKAAIHRFISALKTQQLRTLTDIFYYPENGTGQIYATIKEQLEKRGYPIQTNSYPLKIVHQNNRIKEILIQTAKKQEWHKVNYLIESIPMEELIRILDPLPPLEIFEAAAKLKYRDQVYLFITLNKERIARDQWIYFPEKQIPFGRISEMKNFSQKMSPPGKTSLFIEFFCFENDEVWNKSKDELLAITLNYLENLGFCKKEEVRNSYLIKQKKVYPIYDINYKVYTTLIKNYLNQFENLFYIGRPGRFRYNNQDHSLEMGFLAAKGIVEGKKFDFDLIGAEEEYLEKGYLK